MGKGGSDSAREPSSRDALREEIRPLEIRPEHFLEGFLACVEYVHPYPRTHARVVYEGVDRSERREDFVGEGGTLCGIANVALEHFEPLEVGGAGFGAEGEGFPGRDLIAGIVDGDGKSASGQFEGDAPSQTAAGSRHESNRWARPRRLIAICRFSHGDQHGAGYDVCQAESFPVQ